MARKQQQSKALRALDKGRDPHYEKLMHRPNGFIDNRPRKQRTRATAKREAIRNAY